MSRNNYFTNWIALSQDVAQMPQIIDAVDIVRPTGPGTSQTYYFAIEEIRYRQIPPDIYEPRLKSIGSIVSTLQGGLGRFNVKLLNQDLFFRDGFTVDYVAEPGGIVGRGSNIWLGSYVTARKILIGTLSNAPVETDLVYCFGIVTGVRYSEEYLELDCTTTLNLAPTLANRTINKTCPWEFKGTQCGYSGPLSSCNKLYSSTDGCSGRNNQHRFGGFPSSESLTRFVLSTGAGSAPKYQMIQAGAVYTTQRQVACFDDTFRVSDDPAQFRTVVSAITPDWVNADAAKFNLARTTVTSFGSMTTGSNLLTVDDATHWKVGHGIRVVGAATTAGTSNLVGSHNSFTTTLNLASTASFPSSGVARVNNELVYYSGKTSTQLLNVIRGFHGTIPATHNNNNAITTFNDLTTTVIGINGLQLTLGAVAGNTVVNRPIVHDDTQGILAAFEEAYAKGTGLYLPAGNYPVRTLTFDSRNRVVIQGDGAGRSTFYSIYPEPIVVLNTTTATSHTILLEGLGFYGSTIGVENYGLLLKDSGSNGIFNFTLRNVQFENTGNAAIKSEQGLHTLFTALLEGVDVSMDAVATGNAIDLWGSNDTTFLRCYVHNVAEGFAAYRVRSGSVTMIGCNGIDSGINASWGVFGNSQALDGLDSYARVTLIGCNVEEFSSVGIYCRVGSFASFISTQFIAPTSGEVIALRLDYVSPDQIGIFDALSGFQTKGATYLQGSPVHSDGLPFLQLGHQKLTSFFDLSGNALASMPAVNSNRLAGNQIYALTLNGYQQLKGYFAMQEQSSPSTPPSNTGYLYAKDAGSQTGLYWVADGVTEIRLDQPSSGSYVDGVAYAWFIS